MELTPKEKAKELVDKLTLSSNAQDGSWMCKDLAKECALIAVDEILEVISFNKYDDKYWQEEEYWQEVKQEIEKL